MMGAYSYSEQNYQNIEARIVASALYAARETHPERRTLLALLASIAAEGDRHRLTKRHQAMLSGVIRGAMATVEGIYTERRCWHPDSRTWRPIIEAYASSMGRLPADAGQYDRDTAVTFWRDANGQPSHCVYDGHVPEDYGTAHSQYRKG